MTSAVRRSGPALLFLALVAAVYADPLFVRRNFTGRDLIAYNIPMEKSVHSAWAAGELPVWTPEISGGRPLMPNPNVGAMYPVRIVLSRLPFPVAIRLFPLIHWTAAGIGAILLLTGAGVSPLGAFIGAATYVFSGVSVSESFYPHIQPGMTLLPWMLWVLQRAREWKAGTFLAVMSLLFALDMLAGDVFTIALALACGALWIALEEPGGAQMSRFGVFVAAVALGAVAAAPQILATALWIPETNRGVIGMHLSDATLYSISPWRLLELAVPYPFGPMWRLDPSALWGGAVYRYRGMGLFETLFAGALPVVAVFALRRERRPGLRFALVLLVLALIVGIVPSLLPDSWGKWRSPLPLRNPEKFAVAISLSLSILAAWGFDLLPARRLRAPLLAAGVLAALAAAAAASPAAAGRVATSLVGGAVRLPEMAAQSLPFALAAGALLWAATASALALARRRGYGRLAAAAVLTLVLVAATRPIAMTDEEQAILGPTPFARLIAKRDPAGEYRTLGGEIYRSPGSVRDARYGDGWEIARRDWVHYTHLIWGRGTVFNYDFDAGDLARVESLRKISGLAAAFPDAGPFFGGFALRWCVRQRSQKPLPGYHRFGGDGAQEWDEHERPYPDIRLATAWREEPSALDALHDMAELPQGALALETGRRADGAAPEGRLRILERSAPRLAIETDAPAATWLFVLRAFWGYRRVTVDGREVETVPANIAFTAVAVPAGKHRVDLEEQLPGWELSRWGPVAYGMIAVAAAVLVRRRRPT
ncbi:MAG TPA: hypothetical protein VH854_09105 [Thermoanaerobaculia bacterium]|nr:hypothetical protein [Thermoanaerobaculia bacterium]